MSLERPVRIGTDPAKNGEVAWLVRNSAYASFWTIRSGSAAGSKRPARGAGSAPGGGERGGPCRGRWGIGILFGSRPCVGAARWGRERATRRGVSVHAATRAAAAMEPWTATSATRCIDVWVVRRARTEAPTPSTVTGSSSLPAVTVSGRPAGAPREASWDLKSFSYAVGTIQLTKRLA